MPTTQPRDCDILVPSRFSAERPCTWRLVMDDTARALAERYGTDNAPQDVVDETSLRRRERRMREIIAANLHDEMHGMQRNHEVYHTSSQNHETYRTAPREVPVSPFH